MNNQRRKPRDTVMLSGWLFADLLLGLMVIFLVSTPASIPITLMPTPTMTLTQTPIPTFTPTPTRMPSSTPRPPTPTPTGELVSGLVAPTATPRTVLSKEAVVITFTQASNLIYPNTTGYTKALVELRTEVGKVLNSRESPRAGLVETFGLSKTNGTEIAAAVNAALVKEYPDTFNKDSLIFDYHDLVASPPGAAYTKIFFYVWLYN